MLIAVVLFYVYVWSSKREQSQSSHQITATHEWNCAKTTREIETKNEIENMMPSVLFDDILFKFLYFVLAFRCIFFAIDNEPVNWKQKNNLSINNWTFRYAFFGFLCFKNAKTQQEIFCVCAFHTFQVAKTEISFLHALWEMSANPFNLHLDVQRKFCR